MGSYCALGCGFGDVWDWVKRNQITLLLVLGVMTRVAQFLANPEELAGRRATAQNIPTKSYRSCSGFFPRRSPPGFLVVERCFYQLLGDHQIVLKIFPLLCGVVSVFLLARVAQLCLRAERRVDRPGPYLVAVSDDLVYFASELKQYSTDIAAGLLCDLLALELVARPASKFQLARFGLTGVVIVWFRIRGVRAVGLQDSS